MIPTLIDRMVPVTVAQVRELFRQPGPVRWTDLRDAIDANDAIRHGRFVAARYGQTQWVEVECLPRHVCQYGCKLYARQQGAVVRFAVLHSSVYGHRRVAA